MRVKIEHESKKAIVKEIQVRGVSIEKDLWCAAYELTHQPSIQNRPCKINFTILLPDGSTKMITIRDEGNETVAYGDFEGLPSFLQYSMYLKEENQI